MPLHTSTPVRPTRRDFLAFVVGGAATAAIAASSRGAFAQSADPYHGLKVGVHTYSVRKLSFENAVAATRDLGVRYIGFNPVHLALDSPPEKLAAAKQAVADAGLTLMAIGVIPFDGDEAKARQAFEYARAMGMRTISANPELKSLDLLNDLVQEFDIRIAIHNHGPDSLYQTPGDVLRAVEKYDPRLGACADIGHYERSKVRAADALRELKDRLYDMHLKDVDKAEASGKSVVLGTGIIDFRAVFETLLDIKFDGHVALEYEDEPDNPIPGMQACFSYAREILGTLTPH